MDAVPGAPCTEKEKGQEAIRSNVGIEDIADKVSKKLVLGVYQHPRRAEGSTEGDKSQRR